MEHHLGLRRPLPDGTDAGREQPGDSPEIGGLPHRPEQALGDLIAHRHHLGQQVFPLQRLQHLGGVVIDRPGQPLLVQAHPGLGHPLLAGIRPEITVVEIQQPVQPRRLDTAGQADDAGQVIGARPVGLSLWRIGVVPEADAHQIGAVAFEDLQGVSLLSPVEEAAAAALHLRQGGQIHTNDPWFHTLSPAFAHRAGLLRDRPR